MEDSAVGLGANLNRSTYADVCLEVRSKQFHAHKSILSSRSDYFKKLFQSDKFTSSQDVQVIQVPNVISPENFYLVLLFIYTDKIRIPFDVAAVYEILQIVQLYQLSSLEYRILPKYKKYEKSHSGHPRYLWKDIAQLLGDPITSDIDTSTPVASSFCDITIIVENASYACHKVILASRSAYFDRMFRWNWRESNQDVVVLNDVTKDMFDIILNFMYKNELEIETIEDAVELHKLAEFFQMDALINYCEDSILSNFDITEDSVAVLWNCATELRAETLAQQCKKFFVQNFVACSKSSNFGKLEKSLLKAALNSGEIEEDEDVVFSVVKKWGEEALKMSQGNVEDIIADLLPPWVMFNSKLRSMLLSYGMHASSGVPDIRSFL